MVNNLFRCCTENRSLFVWLALFAIFITPVSAIGSSWPSPPTIGSKSWAIIDARSGQVIAEHNSSQQLPPASLTKMMTMYLAFEAIREGRLNINDTVDVSKKAWKIGGSTMFLEPRLKPSVEQILHGIATLSGNDACIALAEHVDGSEEAFAERMNKKAAELGLKHSHFANATGFPMQGHYSSAMDMALIGAALWRDFPEQYKMFGEKEYTFDKHTQPNRNRLLWSFPGADGIKTGHTKEAGYCLVGSAEKDNTRFVTAVFSTKSDRARAQQTRTLLKFSFTNFVTLRPKEIDIRRKVEVFEGTEDHVWLKPASPIWVTVPKGKESSLSFRLRYDAPLKAEIKKDQSLGSIDAVLNGKKDDATVLKSVAMVAARDVERASWLGRQWDSLRLWGRGSMESFLAEDEEEIEQK